jgi:Zn-dependent metalloprotease
MKGTTMKSKLFLLAIVAVSGVLLLGSSGARAEGKFWNHSPPRYPGQSPEKAAAWFLSENPQLYNAGSVDELQWLETPRLGNIAYVRFQQVHRGVIVEGAQLVLTVDDGGRIFQLSDSTVSPLFLPDPAFCVSAEAARERLLQENPGAVPEDVRGPLYVAGDGPSAWLVWAVRARTDGRPFGLWDVYIDCDSGEPVGFKDLIRRAEGNVYDPNPIVNPVVQRVTLENLTSATNLNGSLAASYACSNAACDDAIQRAVADTDGNFLYDPEEPSITDPFSEVTAYYHVDKINTWYETQLGYTKVCNGSRLVSVVVNMDYLNAFAMDIDRDGCLDIVLGGDSGPGGHDFAYDADVIYHEYTHGVNRETAGFRGMAADNLGYDFSSGALDEGYADYFSIAQTDDPTLGEYALAGATRHADNTRTCPKSLQGESHEDGQVWTGTLWEIRDAIGDHETDILALAVLQSLTSRADYNEAGQALITQAGLLETAGTIPAGGGAAVEGIVNARGLPGCERIITLNDGDTARIYLMGLQEWGGWVSQIPGGVQFAVPVPADAVRAVLRFTALAYGTASYDVYVNHNAPVGFTTSGRQPVPSTYAYMISGAPDGITWAGFTDPPILPGTTYYIAFVSKCDYTALLTIDATVVVSSPSEEGEVDGSVEEEVPEAIDAAEATEDVLQEYDDSTAPDMLPQQDADAAGEDDISGLITSEGGCGCRTVQ